MPSTSHAEQPTYSAPGIPAPTVPRVVVDGGSPGEARRLRNQRAAGVVLVVLALANAVRLSVVEHLWWAVPANAVLLCAVPVVMAVRRRRVAAAAATAPPGTLFGGGFCLDVGQLAAQPRFRAAAGALGGRGQWGSGHVSGHLFLSRDAILLEAERGLPEELAQLPTVELAAVRLKKMPTKLNRGGLALTFVDGSTLIAEVQQYDCLRAALGALAAPSPN